MSLHYLPKMIDTKVKTVIKPNYKRELDIFYKKITLLMFQILTFSLRSRNGMGMRSKSCLNSIDLNDLL